MRRALILAVAAPFILIGAALPKPVDDGPETFAPAVADAPAPVTYRPCRPGAGDDRCIQLYERGVRASYARWLRHHGVDEPRSRVAMGGPSEPRARHPHRHRHAVAENCVDPGGPGDEARGM